MYMFKRNFEKNTEGLTSEMQTCFGTKTIDNV